MLHEQKDMPAAVAAYDRALAINSRLFWVHVLRGNARYHTGDWRGLRADYETAFAQGAARAAAFAVRVLRKELEPDPDKGLRECEDHLRRDPEDAMSLARRGLLRVLLGRDDEAVADFEQCRKLWPDSAPYLAILVEEAGKRRRLSRPGNTVPIN